MSHTHNPSLLPPDREEGTFNLMQLSLIHI